jgi:hypothetical protein
MIDFREMMAMTMLGEAMGTILFMATMAMTFYAEAKVMIDFREMMAMTMLGETMGTILFMATMAMTF